MKKFVKRILPIVLSIVLVMTTVLSAVMFVDAAAVEKAGPNVDFSFDSKTGTMTFTGSGEMYDFRDTNIGSYHKCPWAADKPNIKKVVVGEGITTIGTYSFYKCDKLTTVELPNSLKEIHGWGVTGDGVLNSNTASYGAFRACTSLESITLPSNLVSIGDVAFRECTSLKSIVIPDTVTSLGRGAFVGCTNLKTVHIGNGVSEIPVGCFYNDTGLKTIEWGSNVTKVNEWAFYNSGMDSVVIPESITSIDGRAFADNYYLLNATIYNRKCTIANLAFNNTRLTRPQDFTVHGYTNSTAQTFAEGMGYTFVSIDACPHEVTHTVTIPATCEEDGVENVICDACKNIINETVLEKTGHEYIDIGDPIDETELTGHIRQLTKCSKCEKEVETITHVVASTTTLGVNKYVWVKDYDYTNTANCQRSGTETYRCKVEGCNAIEVNVVRTGGHTVSTWVVMIKPTCTTTGMQKGHCSVCDTDVEEEIPALGHSIDEENIDHSVDKVSVDGHIYNYYVCIVCGEESVKLEHKEWVGGNYSSIVVTPARCVIDGLGRDKCDLCGETRNVTLKANGEHVWEVTSVIEPKCASAGQTNYKCANCELTKKDVTQSLGHDLKLVKRVNPTCLDDGAETYECQRDGCGYSNPEVVPALGHLLDESSYNVVVAPKCESAGEASDVCGRCRQTYSIPLDALGHEYEDKETAIVDKPGHSLITPTCIRCSNTQPATVTHVEWIDEYISTQVIEEQNCVTGEISIDTCTLCNTTRTNTKGEGLGHEYRYSRTVNTNGTAYYWCKHCNLPGSADGEQLHKMWDNKYYNTVSEGRNLDYNFSSYLDVTGDGFINGKDYAKIEALYKAYLAYREAYPEREKDEESSRLDDLLDRFREERDKLRG